MVCSGAVFKEHLFSNPPTLSKLYSYLSKTHSLSSRHAEEIVYQVALQLNNALFPPITQMELFLAEGCNLACKYCFEKDMPRHGLMSFHVAKTSLDLLFDYSQNEKNLYVTYFGGEPTLNFKVMQQVTEYAEMKALRHEKSISLAITTNGVLIDQSMADYFAEHGIKALLSIDGLETTHNRFRLDKHGHGTFEQVMKGMEILKKTQPWIGARMTVMPENVISLFDDVSGLHKMGVNQFIIAHATDIKWSNEIIRSYCKQLNKLFEWYKEERRPDLRISAFEEKAEVGLSYFGCQAGRNTISVASNGEISPCSKVLALNNRRLLVKLGDVRHGLTHFYNRREIVECSMLREACEAKGIAAEFKGGCFASNYDENKDIFLPSLQEHTFSKACRQTILKSN